MVTDLTINGEKTGQPKNHVIHFIGEHPCNQDGSRISALTHGENRTALTNEITVDRSFSHKPGRNYHDYYEKITTYIAVISAPVRSMDYSITAQTYKLIESVETESIFNYPDTNSSRAKIEFITDKLRGHRIGIIGLGGTGSYVLDFVSKTPISEIHLFDSDRFQVHNSFRTPGAPKKKVLVEMPKKVNYLHQIYSRMHGAIIPHDADITSSNLSQIEGFDFVFICIDKGEIKRDIINFLINHDVCFIDVGMGVEVSDNNSLFGTIRTTTWTNGKNNPLVDNQRISFGDGAEDDEYNQNIQISELNALNAAFAVIKWKKLCGFYFEAESERHSLYSLDDNSIINEDISS